MKIANREYAHRQRNMYRSFLCFELLIAALAFVFFAGAVANASVLGATALGALIAFQLSQARDSYRSQRAFARGE